MPIKVFNNINCSNSDFGCGYGCMEVHLFTGWLEGFRRATATTAHVDQTDISQYYSWTNGEKYLPSYRAAIWFQTYTEATGWRDIVYDQNVWSGYTGRICVPQSSFSKFPNQVLTIDGRTKNYGVRWRYGDNWSGGKRVPQTVWDTDWLEALVPITYDLVITAPQGLRYDVVPTGKESIKVSASVSSWAEGKNYVPSQGGDPVYVVNPNIKGITAREDGYAGTDGNDWTWKIVLRLESSSGQVVKTITLNNNGDRGGFEKTITGLSPNTKYYVEVQASNNYSQVTSINNKSVTTLREARLANRFGSIIRQSRDGLSLQYKGIKYGKQITVENRSGIRYIRDCINGSNMNEWSHWVEIKAITHTGLNRALGKIPTGNKEIWNASVVTNGLTSSGDNDYATAAGTGVGAITIDLGAVYHDIKEIQVWHYWQDGRIYKDHTLSVGTKLPTDATAPLEHEVSKMTGTIEAFNSGNQDWYTLPYGVVETQNGTTYNVERFCGQNKTVRRNILLPHKIGKIDNCVQFKARADRKGFLRIPYATSASMASGQPTYNTHSWVVSWGDGSELESLTGTSVVSRWNPSIIEPQCIAHTHQTNCPGGLYTITIMPSNLQEYGWFNGFGTLMVAGGPTGDALTNILYEELITPIHAKMFQLTYNEQEPKSNSLVGGITQCPFSFLSINKNSYIKFANDFTWTRIGNRFLEDWHQNVDLSAMTNNISEIGDSFLSRASMGRELPIKLPNWTGLRHVKGGFMNQTCQSSQARTPIDLSPLRDWYFHDKFFEEQWDEWQITRRRPSAFMMVHSNNFNLTTLTSFEIPYSFYSRVKAKIPNNSWDNYFDGAFSIDAPEVNGGDIETGQPRIWRTPTEKVSFGEAAGTPSKPLRTFSGRTRMYGYNSLHQNWK